MLAKTKPQAKHLVWCKVKNTLSAHYLDGQVLARLNQIDAARDQFKTCLTCVSPGDPSYLRAQHFAEDRALSTHAMAPPFTVTALDGSKFNLDAMGGRVVLIDFWATWCGPCNEELPHMKKIAKEFAGQPLVIISVSWDSDETKWKNFIDKNEMTWIQYRDADHHLSNLFQINSIPHYFTIDSDGVLTAEMMGSGSDVEGKLKKLIARAKAPAPVPTNRVGN
jgi:thiol-disulfide isomerase/thioredoxin